ncbi:MAG: hypothetical protein IKD61_07165 [Oscillospiraceae bacterium]|nr:hypothetical protein [Oscillospiraceae bacterium]
MILFVSAILILLAGVAGYFIFRRGYVVAIALVLSAALTVLSCVATVPTGHTGVVTTFGKVEDYTLDAGVHLVKPWQQVVKMDNRVQKQTVKLACFSSDIQEVNMA